MRERSAVVTALLAGGGALILPVPPMPPAGGPLINGRRFPSLTLQAPDQEQPDRVRLGPEFFSLDSYNQSEGNTPGSRIAELPGHRQPVRAGFGLSIPLQ